MVRLYDTCLDQDIQSGCSLADVAKTIHMQMQESCRFQFSKVIGFVAIA
jgi:hypothetical protein